MNLKTRDLLLIVTILAVPLFAGWSYFRPRMTLMEQQSVSDDHDGLQLAIRSLERQGVELNIIYSFRWATGKERKAGFFSPVGCVEILFLDSKGQEIGLPTGERPMFMLHNGFQYGNRVSSEQYASVPIPADAKYVAVRYVDMTTKKVAIPEAGEAP